MVGNAESVVNFTQLIKSQPPDFGVVVTPAELALAPVQARVKIEGGRSAVLPQQRHETYVGCYPIVPALHDLHVFDASLAAVIGKHKLRAQFSRPDQLTTHDAADHRGRRWMLGYQPSSLYSGTFTRLGEHHVLA